MDIFVFFQNKKYFNKFSKQNWTTSEDIYLSEMSKLTILFVSRIRKQTT